MKCAIVGAGGPRAKGLASAYELITNAELTCASSRNQERLDEFCDRFQIENKYRDYHEMFAKEKPDLVQVNTPADARLEIFEAANDAGIPALIVEKPLAKDLSDLKEIKKFNEIARTRVYINHQLHFHPRRRELLGPLHAGELGNITFIDSSCKLNVLGQGTHMLEAISDITRSQPVERVFAQCGGPEGFDDVRHPAPEHLMARLEHKGGTISQLTCGPTAKSVDSEVDCMNKRFSVYAERGHIHWTMNSWEIRIGDKVQKGHHDYMQEDQVGQAALVNSVLDDLAYPASQHPLRLENAINDFETLLAMLQSAITRGPVTLPLSPSQDLMPAIRTQLTKTA